eukprot:3941188-Rhodomonas_salina.1
MIPQYRTLPMCSTTHHVSTAPCIGHILKLQYVSTAHHAAIPEEDRTTTRTHDVSTTHSIAAADTYENLSGTVRVSVLDVSHQYRTFRSSGVGR